MKNITLPKELRNLPHPWRMTHSTQRREQLGSLSQEKGSIKTALNVLERCLHTLPHLTLSETRIPEELNELWSFSAEWLAERIPTFDEFDLNKVEQFLISDEGLESPSPSIIKDVGQYWLWWITRDIERAALRWVEDAFGKNRDLILISRFLLIVERNWQKIEPDLAQSLLSSSAIIGWQKALPLFERVQQNPLASEEVKETARDYHRFVLKYPQNWLPEAEEQEESPQSKRVATAQPAFGQLAWGTTS